MLIKLIAVDSYHFVRYKCKITHCPDSQTSEYISAIILDDNEKLSTSEVLDVTVGSGTFTSASSLGTQSLQFVTMNEFKKYVPGGFYLFTFYLAVQKCLLSVGIGSYFTQGDVCRKNGQVYLSIVQEYQAWKNCVPHVNRARKTSKTHPIFRTLTFCLVKRKQNIRSTSFQSNR